jgi:hypothetical protein
MSSFKTLNFRPDGVFKYVKMSGSSTVRFFSNASSFVDSCHFSCCKKACDGASVESKVCCREASVRYSRTR